MRFAFLGTGGSYPSRERMTQAFAVRYKGDVVLFDCGEGTQRQMMLSSLSFMQVKTICITHFHGDHSLGLPGLIQTMQLNDRKEPLDILVPKGSREHAHALIEIGHFKLKKYEARVHEMADGERLAFDGYSITAAALNHPVPTVGFRLDEDPRTGRFDPARAKELGVPEGPLFSRLQDGHAVEGSGGKVSPSDVMGPSRRGRAFCYLTDTAPTPRAVEVSRGADILVMEATADDSLTDYANQYGHCAASQTAQTAKDAGVLELYIVHLSARYKESEPILSQARAVFPNSKVPHDLEEVEYPWG
jgi:ribonuclease Z